MQKLHPGSQDMQSVDAMHEANPSEALKMSL